MVPSFGASRGTVTEADRTVKVGNVPLTLVWCPSGDFVMGSPPCEMGRFPGEVQHKVKITKGFWLGKYEVTQRQWEALMKNNPSDFCKEPIVGKVSLRQWNHRHEFSRKDCPVECVSWDDAVAFCRTMSERERAAGKLPEGYVYQLPTEAQWEYACRAGTTTPFHYGENISISVMNFDGREPYVGKTKECSRKETVAVGLFKPNAWGLCDMHGNVWEWCSDWFGDYPVGEATDPVGPAEGVRRVTRGGAWDEFAQRCRSAVRGISLPEYRGPHIGFRVALIPAKIERSCEQ